MTWQFVSNIVWPAAMLLFLSLSVAQLSERMKARVPEFRLVGPQQTVVVAMRAAPTPTRTTAMLGGACVLLAAFWGFDVLLSWYLRIMSSG